MEREGRHRYYRLSGPLVAAALEAVAALVAAPLHSRGRRASQSLRLGRTCYDHISGELGVAFALALEEHGFVSTGEGKRLNITKEGVRWFDRISIDTAQLRPGRHRISCRCLDWTERRHHVAGPLGAAMLRIAGHPAGSSGPAIALEPSSRRDAARLGCVASRVLPSQPSRRQIGTSSSIQTPMRRWPKYFRGADALHARRCEGL